jgi:hypothetical protein
MCWTQWGTTTGHKRLQAEVASAKKQHLVLILTAPLLNLVLIIMRHSFKVLSIEKKEKYTNILNTKKVSVHYGLLEFPPVDYIM